MSDKSGDGRDPYLYPDLNVMRNRLGTHRAQRLAQAAYKLTVLRVATTELGPLKRGLPHLRAIYRQLYRDILDWAGHLREVDIYQDDTCPRHFTYIEKGGNAPMQSLKDEPWLMGLPENKFVDRLAHYYCETDVLHPFRIGSGLAQRTFFEQLTIHAGYMSSWDSVPVGGWNQANQSGAIGDLSVLWVIFRKVVNEAPETE